MFENGRYLPIKGWGSKGHLLPTDRSKYSLGRRNAKSQMDFPVFPLPKGAPPNHIYANVIALRHYCH